MVSLSKLSNTPNVSVNVKSNVNVNMSKGPGNGVATSTLPSTSINSEETAPEGMLSDRVAADNPEEIATTVHYTPNARIYSESEYNKLRNVNEVLRTIIDLQRNNPLIYSGYIVADDVKLMKFIQLLTFADDVQLDTEDLGEGCLSKKTYRKIHAIYVIKDGETKNLKYDYPRVMKELTDLGISTKFVW